MILVHLTVLCFEYSDNKYYLMMTSFILRLKIQEYIGYLRPKCAINSILIAIFGSIYLLVIIFTYSKFKEGNEVEEVAEADHAGDLVLGEIEGCKVGEGAEMGDVGKSVDGVVEFLKACALSNVELYFF